MSDKDRPIQAEEIYADDPRYDGFRIKELWAYTFVDEKTDQEGFALAFDTQQRVLAPMMGTDMARIDSLRPKAEELAKMEGVKVKLLHFTGLEVVEEIE